MHRECPASRRGWERHARHAREPMRMRRTRGQQATTRESVAPLDREGASEGEPLPGAFAHDVWIARDPSQALQRSERQAHNTGPMERQTLTAEDGFELAMVRWLPSGTPRGVLQISHGMAEYASRYAPFAEACNAAGIAVYAHDHRGHGGSIDVTTPRGHYADHDGWSKVVGDLETVQQRIRALHPGAPIFLMGHSMGSFIARAVLLRSADAFAGAIISATGWRTGPLGAFLRWSARREVQKLGPREPSAKMAKLIFGFFNVQFMPARTKFDWLSRDPEQVDLYVNDPMCGFDCSGQLW